MNGFKVLVSTNVQKKKQENKITGSRAYISFEKLVSNNLK